MKKKKTQDKIAKISSIVGFTASGLLLGMAVAESIDSGVDDEFEIDPDVELGSGEDDE